MNTYTYSLLTMEKGYNLLLNNEPYLYQPEPHIPYRVLAQDGITTDYANSAEAHIADLTKTQQSAPIPLEVQIEELRLAKAVSESEIDERLSKLELGLVK